MSDTAYTREERFERFIAVLIALTSIFIAVTAYLERLASDRSEEFKQQAQTLSIQTTTGTVSGALRLSYDWQGAFQTWRELDLSVTNAEQLGLTELADLYRSARDEVRGFSPMLQQPYFDEQFNWPDSYAYAADLYIVESARLQERFESKSRVANIWDQISNNFVLQITLYAVSLSLFGLSTTIHSFVRWIFIGLAGLIILVNTLWSAVILYRPVDEIPSQAIEAYARAMGLAYQGKHAEAVTAFDEAIFSYSALPGRPRYANAYFNRSFSHLSLGNYELAAQDLEATMAAGRRDTTVLWNLGWTYYLLGRFEESVAINQQALQIDPTLVGLRLNQGLNMLAQGRFENAAEEYRQALAEAERQIQVATAGDTAVPPSLWYYMEAGAFDIQSLIDQVTGNPQAWTQAPAAQLLNVDVDRLVGTGTAEIARLSEYIVSLEFFGTAPRPPANRTVSAFAFVQESFDENGDFIEYIDSTVNAFGTNQIGILFDYSGLTTGAHEVWKVYVNGYEDTTLRVVGNWELGESGSAIKWISYAFSNVFSFLPGDFRVELYIDTQLMQTGHFTVMQP